MEAGNEGVDQCENVTWETLGGKAWSRSSGFARSGKKRRYWKPAVRLGIQKKSWLNLLGWALLVLPEGPSKKNGAASDVAQCL